MAITSVGYDGTVDEKQFRDIMGFSASSEYGVAEPGAFAASSVAGQLLQVRVAAGTAWTAGVVDKMDAADTVQFDPVASGSRWDMIVLRRDYQPPGGATTLRVVKGGASMALPARANDPGVLDDQPLWLAKVEAGKSAPAQYIDLRLWARNGGATANHELVRSYMDAVGTEIEINNTVWRRKLGDNNLPVWVDMATVNDTGWVAGTAKASGWGINTDFVTCRRIGNQCEVMVYINRTGSDIPVPSNGNIGNTQIASIPAGFAPAKWGALSSGPGGPNAAAHVDSAGRILLTSVAPGRNIRKGDSFAFSGMYFIG